MDELPEQGTLFADPTVPADEVLLGAGLEVPAEQEDEVERFREFLDHVSPEDFESR